MYVLELAYLYLSLITKQITNDILYDMEIDINIYNDKVQDS